MFEFFGQTVKVLTDSTTRWTTKSITILLILSGLWFLNETFDFTSSYRLNNRLQQLEKVSVLLEDKTLTEEQRLILTRERERIFVHRTNLDRFYSWLNSLPNLLPSVNSDILWGDGPTEKELNQTGKSEVVKNDKSNRNYWLNFVSSNFFLLFMMVGVVLYLPYKQALAPSIIGGLFMIGAFYLLCMFIAFLFGLLPTIASRPWINYTINFLVQGTIWWAIGFASQRAHKKSTS